MPAFAFAALEPLLEQRAPGRRREKGEAERGRLTAVVVFSIALMAGAVVIEVDPWGQSDISVETL